jgi:hypothetical protein
VNLRVDLAAPSVRLEQPDEFRSLKVVVAGEGDLPGVLAPYGTLAGEEHTHLRIDGLRELAGERAADPEWQRRFAAMIDYAGACGWVDADGRTVRAHRVRA